MWRSVKALRWIQVVAIPVWGLCIVGVFLLDRPWSAILVVVQIVAMSATVIALFRTMWLITEPRRSGSDS